MSHLESQTLKYLLVLAGMVVLKNVIMFVFTLVLHRMDVRMQQNLILYGFGIQKHLVNLLFALFLYYDCKKEKHGKLLISLLGFFQPLIGTVFFFIATFLLHPQKNKS